MHPQDALIPELVADRKRARRRIAMTIAVSIALFVLAFEIKPIYGAVKGWRARRLAAQAEVLMDAKKWREAGETAQAAYQLKPDESSVVRAIAHFQSRTGRLAAAIPFWRMLEKQNALTLEDRRSFAADLFRSGALADAEKMIAGVIKDQPGEVLAWQIAAKIQGSDRRYDQAIASAEHALQLDPKNSESRLLLASLRAESSQPAVRETGFRDLIELARDPGEVGLAALVFLAQRADFPAQSAASLIPLLKAHPLAREEHRLLALDWALRCDPASRAALIENAMSEHRTADAAAKRLFGIWLNTHGEFAHTLSLLPLAESMRRKDLLLVHLDALAGLKRWPEIEQILGQKDVPLDAAYIELFLARCATEQGDRGVADLHWRRAHLAAASSPEQKLFIGAYAEKIGETEQAETAYRSLVSNATVARQAYEGLLRLANQSGDAEEELSVLEEMQAHWPSDPAVQNDCAYLNLLLAKNLDAARKTAEGLVARFPANLPHRTTLALACIRENDPAAALRVYEGLNVNWNRVPPNALAVHAAALALAGQHAEARDEAGRVPLDRLQPQERDLIQKLVVQ